jgi:hypothetical protein
MPKHSAASGTVTSHGGNAAALAPTAFCFEYKTILFMLLFDFKRIPSPKHLNMTRY